MGAVSLQEGYKDRGKQGWDREERMHQGSVMQSGEGITIKSPPAGQMWGIFKPQTWWWWWGSHLQ